MTSILIVDDEASSRETLEAMLDGKGYQIEMAKNGTEGLDVALHIQPDLILLDVMMPGMNGFEVCQRLRSTPQLAEVPIIMLTALDDRASLVQGLEAGADDFISKPVERQELVARAHTVTRLNRYRTLLEQRENLREMAERLIVAQEAERIRISRELHDDLGQALTTHMLALRNMQHELSVPSSDSFQRLQALYEQTHEIFMKIRQLAQDLRPPALDTLGFQLALQNYTREFTHRTHLPITLEIDPAIPVLPDVYNVTFYRVLQEALTNVVKHARASRAWVELSLDEDDINLIVQDNGQGLPAAESHSDGIGITGMKERLSLVGGKLVLRSPSEGGTILSASLPLRASRSDSTELE